MRYYRLYLHLQKKMVILDRKIVHNVQTMCSHITYTEFNLPFHRHSEYELILFTSGSGTEFVGEGVADYKKGDVALIGSNIPHLHLCKSRMGNSQETEAMEHSTSETIQFSPGIFPPDILNLPDYEHIADLLSKSQYGIRFYDEGLYEDLLSRLSLFDSQSYTRRLIALYEILERLYNCSQTKLLSPIAFSHYKAPNTDTAIDKVFTYLYNNFQKKIVLTELADFVSQNPTSLCRYFKKCTNKSIFQVLANIRIEYACKLLTHSNLTVNEVAFNSGYNTPTLFYEQFLREIHLTPNEYRQHINAEKISNHMNITIGSTQDSTHSK